MQTLKPITINVKTELPKNYLSNLLDFLQSNLNLPLNGNITNVMRISEDAEDSLNFKYCDSSRKWYVDSKILLQNEEISIILLPSDDQIPEKNLNRLREYLLITIENFQERFRRNNLYFAWVPNKEKVYENPSKAGRSILSKIFLGNMVTFFIIFIAISSVIFLIAQEYTPIVLVVLQFFMVIFADKIIKRLGDWPITAASPNVYILQYLIPKNNRSNFRKNFPKNILLKVKREIYDETLALGQHLASEKIEKVFLKYGLAFNSENLLIKKINIYNLVKKAAEKFKIRIPKIMLSNVVIPNAAATGPDPRFSLILVTSGLLIRLDEEEIFSVIGHEMSHLKNRDPIVLFILVSIEYLLRIYLLWQYFFFLGIFYIFFAFEIVFFIAKFFEARADLQSAIYLKNPSILAKALTKIGYKKISYERMSSTNIGAWFGLNPHPPISFRVERLYGLSKTKKIKHIFIQSIKDCIVGLKSQIKLF